MPGTESHQPCPTLGRYQLVELIGEGGMCSVYRAWDEADERAVAVKVLNDLATRNDVLIRRFEQEFRSGASFDHPNIVRTFEFAGDHSPPYLVMELIDGPTLGQYVTRHGPMSEAEAIRVTVDICRGLKYAHDRGVIHRDVKPDNVLILDDGSVKVADFGLAKELFGDANLTVPGKMVGTPAYMAPEQLRQANEADARSDVYGVGATMYALVTGEMPFAGRNARETLLNKMTGRLRGPREFAPALSGRTEDAIMRAMAYARRDRPFDLAEFVRDLTGGGLDDGPPTGDTAEHAVTVRQTPRAAGAMPPVATVADVVIASDAVRREARPMWAVEAERARKGDSSVVIVGDRQQALRFGLAFCVFLVTMALALAWLLS